MSPTIVSKTTKLDRVREVGPTSVAAQWLEKAVVACLFLFVAFAPHSIAVTQTAWLLGMLFWVIRFAFYPPPRVCRTPIDYALISFFILTGILFVPVVRAIHLIVWLIFLAICARMLWRLARNPAINALNALNDWVERGVVLGALGGLCGFFTSGLVHYNWGDSEVVMIFYSVVGLTLALEIKVRLSRVVNSDLKTHLSTPKPFN